VTPVLGGSFGTDNIVVLDFVVGLSLTGQDQIRRLPPGTKIAGIEVSNAGELRSLTFKTSPREMRGTTTKSAMPWSPR
jgi:hypothetical protein